MRAASYCDVTLIYHSDTVSMDGRFHHHNGVVSQGCFSMAAHRHDRRGIYRCVLLRFLGRIEIDHSYMVCAGVVCAATPGTALLGPAGAAAQQPAPLVLCREWQHKPLQRRPYRGQFLYYTGGVSHLLLSGVCTGPCKGGYCRPGLPLRALPS